MNVGHKQIHRFQYTGVIADDSYIPRMRSEYERLLEDSMKERGYLRLYDVDSAFSTEYSETGYNFVLTVYGVYVGKRVAECSAGILAGKVMVLTGKNTLNTKFDPSSIPSA